MRAGALRAGVDGGREASFVGPGFFVEGGGDMGRNPTGLHHPAAVYAKQVTQGKLREQCCKWEILACERFLKDLERQGTEAFPY